MKIIILASLVALLCCSDKKSVAADAIYMTSESSSKETILPKTKTDTFNLESPGKLFDSVLVSLIKKERRKDGDSTGFYRIDFISGQQLQHTYTLKIDFDMEGRQWSLYENFMQEPKTKANDPRFLNLSNGYPACGYGHDNFLFFVNNGKIAVVDTWQSVFDGGFGSDRTFIPTYKGNVVTSFSGYDVEIDQAENSTDSLEILQFRYKDSVRFDFKSGNWKKKRLTPKGKVYRTEQRPFDEYYKQE